MRADRRADPARSKQGRTRVLKAGASLALLAGLLAIGSAAAATGSPAGGRVQVFGTPKGGGGTVLFTGAIGDAGTNQRQTATGAPNANGSFIAFKLKNGTFVGNGTNLFAALNHAKFSFNPATCSGVGSAKRSVPLSHGTGLYAGISGTVIVTVTFAEIGPRIKSGKHKGQCSMNQNAKPIAQYSNVAGTGTVKFS